jgi:hypothetical protein
MAAVLAAWPAAALLTRPDREDAEYRELASKYPSALSASAAEAVLIAPRWLLTRGSHAQALQKAGRLEALGERIEIEAVFLHPSHTFGLILLRTALRDAEPSPVYRGRDERGRAVAIAAHGRGAARAAINTVDRVEANTLSLRVKPLSDASDLQGALTPDELGAPLFIEVDGEPFVAGLALDAGAEWQTFARLSSYASWIDDAMWNAATSQGQTPGTDPGDRPRGPSPVSR